MCLMKAARRLTPEEIKTFDTARQDLESVVHDMIVNNPPIPVNPLKLSETTKFHLLFGDDLMYQVLL